MPEVVAMGVGGMVSGGIYAVLGVAMRYAGNAVAISYLLAGILTLITAYSYVKLTLHFREAGGAFSFLEHTADSETLVAYFGWILLVGYVGVMAMYAFAFGAFTLTAARALFAVSLPSALRPLISVGVVGLFVALNLSGVEETGLFEDVAVYIKIVVLLSLAGLGTYYFQGDWSGLDFFNRGYLSPVTGFAIIFVSYEGFQLITYDYREIDDVDRNMPSGMYLAVGISILIYVAVSFMATLYLTPDQLIQHKETALAQAVSHIPLLGEFGFVLVILSAIKSTSSGINSTLFGASRLAHKVAVEEKMPRVFSFRDSRGIPVYSLLAMGGLTALFTAFGSLEQITEFGSITFLVCDAVANYVNLRLYRQTGSNPLLPAVGLLGTVLALPILVYHLFWHEFGILVWIVGIFLGLFLLEWLYMHRLPMHRWAAGE